MDYREKIQNDIAARFHAVSIIQSTIPAIYNICALMVILSMISARMMLPNSMVSNILVGISIVAVLGLYADLINAFLKKEVWFKPENSAGKTFKIPVRHYIKYRIHQFDVTDITVFSFFSENQCWSLIRKDDVYFIEKYNLIGFGETTQVEPELSRKLKELLGFSLCIFPNEGKISFCGHIFEVPTDYCTMFSNRKFGSKAEFKLKIETYK